MRNKVVIIMALMLVLIPMALGFNVEINCPPSVEVNSNIDCLLSLDAQGEEVRTFQFKFLVPDGFTVLNTEFSDKISYNGIDSNIVAFSMSPISGNLGTISFTSGLSSGVVDLIDKVPAFITTPANIQVGKTNSCHNGKVDVGEACDGSQECTTSDGYPGTKSCSAECTQLSECVPIGSCGDGYVYYVNEQCDGTNLDDHTCLSEGFNGGQISCTSSCTLDTSGCLLGETIVDAGNACNLSLFSSINRMLDDQENASLLKKVSLLAKVLRDHFNSGC
jgi:hypothetical protein